MNKYEDIINLPHHEPVTRPRMSLEKRAAQFAPYQSLNGYNDTIKETARLTTSQITLTDELTLIINSKLDLLNTHIQTNPEIIITFFIKDKTKSGGIYKTIKSSVKKIDSSANLLILTDKTKIKFSDILNIEYPL